MTSVALAGVANPRSLGDALQCSVMVRLVRKSFPNDDLSFFCPNIKNGFCVFEGSSLDAHKLDLGPVGECNVLAGTLLQSFLRRSTFKRVEKRTSEVSNKEASMVLKISKLINSKCGRFVTFYALDKWANSYIMKPFAFDASIFAGHTICDGFYPYIHKYEALRSATEGPLVLSPISISRLALEYYERKNSKFEKNLMLKRLRLSLQKCDFIFARGPHSHKILRDHLNIDKRKIAMALDSGFGARLINPNDKSSETLRKKIRILVAPRKDYFYLYDKESLYKLYLSSLAALILWLFKNFDAEVYLTSMTVDVKYLGGQTAINDLLKVLERHGNSCLRHLKCVEMKNLASACKLFNSMDLVVSSYMHGGIIALSLGVPAVFILPSADTKVLDVLSFVGFDANSFLIDAFVADSLNAENFIGRIEKVAGNLRFYKRSVQQAINKVLPTLELPTKKLIEFSE